MAIIHPLVFFLALVHAVYAASISTSTPCPPLQWINLTSLLSGSGAPPPLKDASIGYNDGTRTLLIFGGESESGVPQSQTYLLNLDSLTWAQPSPPSGLGGAPPARSAAVSGFDFAASYRTGQLVAGGKDSNGNFLADIWEFDYISQFWAQVNVSSGGPSVLAVGGGIDNINEAFQLNGSLPINTFYVFGGDSSPVSLADAWELEISGALSSNIKRGLLANWTKRTVSGTPPSVSGQGGTVNKQKLISFGGCQGTPSPSVSCATQNATVVDVSGPSLLDIEPCVAPRLGAAVVSNRNSFASAFANQVFVALGTFNTSLWDDGGGLGQGEVDVLDFSAATWTRVVPAGDPGTSGSAPTFPSPRAGAAALSHSSGLVGTSRSGYFDTIVFGGQDAAGNYLNEVWLLRAYNGSVSSSSTRWSGFGDGTLQTGINANGGGVSMKFLSSCATALSHASSSPTISGSISSAKPTTSPTGSTTAVPQANFARYDTATSHKVLAPVSVALLLPAIVVYRLSQPAISLSNSSFGLQLTACVISFFAFGSGLAGLILSFTTIVASPQSASTLAKRAVSSGSVLRTGHGQAGLALFLLLYIVFPVIYLGHSVWTHSGARFSPDDAHDDVVTSKQVSRAASTDPAEKLNSTNSPDGHQYDRSSATTPGPEAPTSSGRRRHRSLTGSSFMASLLPTAERRSSESVALSEPSGPSGPSSMGPHSFEVVNRPRKRQLSTGEGLAVSESSHRANGGLPRRSLSDISWLERRRSVNAVNEIDYALMQLHQQRGPPTPGTADLSTRPLMNVDSTHTGMPVSAMPPAALVLLHLLLHVLVLALSAFALVALWERAPPAAFAVFLVWTVALYVVLIALALRGRPRDSALTVLLNRLRGERAPSHYAAAATPTPSRPLSPTEVRGPYLHQPLYRPTLDDEYRAPFPPSRTGHGVPDEAESDEDEDTRQRRIEEEMQRREVSIVTVPKRKLWVTNPS
ncbi:hypothetical protein K488DRAFT_81712 [Vararia minispora EC-137]|uniref:Uncharacterized protein n=1 Tax=Vararia minispora EC-137 TaxID=1314806 RepID=A0ACB8QXR8_9AGAM|nr:hypothetical protein K488DRAFT_81712 [Vararia minispora EC-137]